MNAHFDITKLADGAVEIAAMPGAARSEVLISAVRITPQFKHARLRVFNRGGGSGELVVNAADAWKVAGRLLQIPIHELEAERGA